MHGRLIRLEREDVTMSDPNQFNQINQTPNQTDGSGQVGYNGNTSQEAGNGYPGQGYPAYDGQSAGSAQYGQQAGYAGQQAPGGYGAPGYTQGYTQYGSQYSAPYGAGQYQYGPGAPYYGPYGARSTKSKIAAGLLGIFLGGFGAHNFYLGNTSKAVAQLLLTLVGWIAFGLGPIAAAIWGFVEGILILCSSTGSPWHRDAQGLELND